MAESLEDFFDDSTAFTTIASTPAPTFGSIKAVLDDFDRRFPKADRCLRVRVSGAYWRALRENAKASPPAAGLMPSWLSGLPVAFDPLLAEKQFVEEMADGTEVLHCGDLINIRRPIQRKE